MTLTDPIGEMLTILRNGVASRQTEVKTSGSKMKSEILEVLKKESFITDFKKEEEKGKAYLLITPAYSQDKEPLITSIRRISKPGRRVYMDKQSIPSIKSGRGIVVLSTSQGIMASKEAKKKGIGGEAILEVW